jgi:hypothetical protein
MVNPWFLPSSHTFDGKTSIFCLVNLHGCWFLNDFWGESCRRRSPGCGSGGARVENAMWNMGDENPMYNVYIYIYICVTCVNMYIYIQYIHTCDMRIYIYIFIHLCLTSHIYIYAYIFSFSSTQCKAIPWKSYACKSSLQTMCMDYFSWDGPWEWSEWSYLQTIFHDLGEQVPFSDIFSPTADANGGFRPE